MLTTLTLAVTLLLPPGYPTSPRPRVQESPTALIGKMLARYAGAKTVVGQIRLTAQDAGGSAAMDTTFALERATNRYYIRQVKKSGEAREWLTVANGKGFTYDLPPGAPGYAPGRRMVEDMGVNAGAHDYLQAYATAASGLGDRSAPLDIAFGRPDDLKFLREMWATVNTKMGSAELREKTVNLITGDYRPAPKLDVAGSYEMAITNEGELLRYAVRMSVDVPGRGPQQVLLTWDCDMDIVKKPDASLFKLKK